MRAKDTGTGTATAIATAAATAIGGIAATATAIGTSGMKATLISTGSTVAGTTRILAPELQPFYRFGGGYYYWNQGYWYPAYGLRSILQHLHVRGAVVFV
jgi:hypothetical protein